MYARPRVVVVGAEAVLGDDDRAARALRRQPHRVPERFGIDLPAGLRGGRTLGWRQHALGADELAGVGLHRRPSRRRVRRRASRAAPPRASAASRSSPPGAACMSTSASDQPTWIVVADRLDRVERLAVRGGHHVERRRRPRPRTVDRCVERRRCRRGSRPARSGSTISMRDEVRLVDRADPRHEVAEVLGHRLRVAREPVGCARALASRRPARTSAGTRSGCR